ncbi:hypothetical protein [Polyangium jinanense]|uniref:Uncharacterized protein n=1 Tax=Polyangium jinanense TaxID=2829994 RepID=A0A9X3X1J0_9BACT|nr:hypothetical protein [Polyangium jinanense]MDC3954517.1 hypothetical protein [Polyangium jinanense]MDC3980820.1 hypothetical protein [Polyangium jinanense]
MSAAWPKMYRTMVPEDPSAKPAVPAVGTAANMLGVRVPPHPTPDVHPDSAGNVGPCGEGLSVAPSLAVLPQRLVPARLRDKRRGARGPDDLHVFRLGEASFRRAPVGGSLELQPTSDTHGVLQPLRQTSVAQYQLDLGATKTSWVDEG